MLWALFKYFVQAPHFEREVPVYTLRVAREGTSKWRHSVRHATCRLNNEVDDA